MGQGEVARLRADMAALAAALRPIAGERLDALWSEIDGIPDATVARALTAAQDIRRMAETPAETLAEEGGADGRRNDRPLAGLFAAFGLGLLAGIFLGRGRR